MKIDYTQLDDNRYQMSVAGRVFISKNKQKLFNKPIRMAHIFFRLKGNRKHMRMTGLFILRDSYGLLAKDTDYSLLCNGRSYSITRRSGLRLTGFIFLLHHNRLPYDDFFNAEIHNTVYLVSSNRDKAGFTKPLQYSLTDKAVGKNKNKRVKIFPDRDTTIFIRQTRANGLCVTSRRSVVSDKPRSRALITLAWLLAKLNFWRKTTLIYEKESARYEESGSVLYEALIDRGYAGFYYVIDKDSNQYSFIADKYKRNLVYKNSFLNYYYFFLCENFIGSEAPSHAMDLRVANKKVITKLEHRNYTHVFLQHGVYFMLSMASKARLHYAQKKSGYFPKGRTHVVVSSELEARHFIDGGGFEEQDMYLTGLPKFDRAYKKDDAQKIVIMPTWRPWEYNIIRTDPENSRYYKMLEEILSGIPNNLKQYVHILPHPLCIRELQNTKLKSYIKAYESYDQVLRDTDILVTDYSSIAYDAFYRGANVIFWWKEKDYCMEQYGGHLMINEGNIFGDIAYTKKDVSGLVERHYNKPQPKKYVNKYRKIVEFLDNKNTDRLIDRLVEDGIIK